jgi:hypothetical protein
MLTFLAVTVVVKAVVKRTAAFGSASGIWTVGGGGEGEYVEYIVDSPSATYTYTVGTSGAGGTAGNNGFAGASGGSGLIVVDEYY